MSKTIKPAKVTKAAKAPRIVAKPGEELRTLALSALIPDPKNVRRFESEAGIDELCAMIVSNGLRQELNVRPAPKGKYYVTAGNRRLRALKELAKRGAVIVPEGVTVTKDYPVRVTVLTDKHNPTEVSLVENIGRTAMHPADQVEAFRTLAEDDGLSAEEIGARFGISYMTVRRRLKLAKLSPKLMEEFRANRATMQQLEALAVSDDHSAQEAAFFDAGAWNRNPEALRAKLTMQKISADNRFVRFVGLQAYEAAGGTITRDLFSDDGDAYLDDKSLVMALVMSRLGEAAEGVRVTEGWKWAEHYASESEALARLPRIDTTTREPTEAERAEAAAIIDTIDKHEAAYDAGQLDETQAAEYESKIARMDALEAACRAYDPALKSYAGVRVFLTHDGAISVRRGYLKMEDQHELAAQERARNLETCEGSPDERVIEAVTPEPSEPHEADGYSAALIHDLTGLRTAALAYEVSKRPDIGLALAVHTLATAIFHRRSINAYADFHCCVRIAATKEREATRTPDADNCAAFDLLSAAAERVRALLPSEQSALLAWCLAAERKTLLDVLAYCVASQIDGQAQFLTDGKLRAADAIAEAVGLDMNKYWSPSASFGKRVSKKTLAAAAIEAGAPAPTAKAILDAPKADAVRIACEALKASGWTPPPMRLRAPVAAATAGQGVAQPDEAEEDDSPEADDEQDGGDRESDVDVYALASVYGPSEDGAALSAD